MKRMASILLTLAAVYLAIVALMFMVQRSLQYFPDPTRVAPQTAGLFGVEEVRLAAPDGTELIGWYTPAREGLATILFFHGNAGSLASRAGRFAAYQQQGFGVLFASYRGYGGSGGKPTQAGIIADSFLFLDWLEGRGVEPSRIAVIGESLGSAVAVRLAARREVGAVILEAPFSSAADIAAAHYWWLPVRALMRDPFDSMKAIGSVSAPVTIIHGDRDTIVPLRYGQRLFEAASEPKEMVVIADAGHNNLLRDEVLRKEFQIVRELSAAAQRGE